MKITIQIENQRDRDATEAIIGVLRRIAESLDVQISPSAEAANLRSWAEVLRDGGEEAESRILRDAADILDDGGFG